MVKFSTVVKVYDSNHNEIPVFPYTVSKRQLMELRKFCLEHGFFLVEEQCIDTCCLPHED